MLRLKTTLATLMLLSQYASAESVFLTCIKNGGTSAYVVEIDESNKTAKTNFGTSTAKFTEAEIVFLASTRDGINYLHTINRTTGNLSIFNESTGKFTTAYTCNKSPAKF